LAFGANDNNPNRVYTVTYCICVVYTRPERQEQPFG